MPSPIRGSVGYALLLLEACVGMATIEMEFRFFFGPEFDSNFLKGRLHHFSKNRGMRSSQPRGCAPFLGRHSELCGLALAVSSTFHFEEKRCFALSYIGFWASGQGGPASLANLLQIPGTPSY